jgi:hypothetical protein
MESYFYIYTNADRFIRQSQPYDGELLPLSLSYVFVSPSFFFRTFFFSLLICPFGRERGRKAKDDGELPRLVTESTIL